MRTLIHVLFLTNLHGVICFVAYFVSMLCYKPSVAKFLVNGDWDFAQVLTIQCKVSKGAMLTEYIETELKEWHHLQTDKKNALFDQTVI